MEIKVLECSSITDSDCTLTLIGEASEIAEAFAAHAAQRHASSTDFTDEIASKLQNAVYVSPQEAYIGDHYEHVAGSDSVHIAGAGMVIQRYAANDASTDAPGGVTLSCKCGAGGVANCILQINGGLAICNNGTCTNCGWVTELPSPLAPPDKILKAFPV